ncbi:uncharacterized protein A1O5_05482 [Cladophialophora psammophila CBS 110553]|uniref:Glyoxalase/fosfomycin resistance/dioxygenase domain-containing protein n=1 Tax=Cladophialophora psammophila CBS 110553 TaxID=1182543 RepID=W9XMU7_9EURO|nr:uncharacterized protein A1O5_05482 [Cladophialophora psammophila CBS 110553]EXJ71674.1 hypothetical protein A1O5_05482 [Cladophialophora psammophila CBS 110553]
MSDEPVSDVHFLDLYKCSDDAYSRVGIWIPVTDPARARKFYSAVLGWKCMENGAPSPIEGIKETYFFTKGNNINGCFCLMDKTNILDTRGPMDKDRVGVHTVFAVRDITESLDLVKENGGHAHLDKTALLLEIWWSNLRRSGW